MIALVLGLGSALMWGISDFMGGHATRRISVVSVTLISQAWALALVAIVVLAAHEALPSGGAALAAVGAGAAVAFGIACFYSALAGGRMGVVAPIGAMGVTIPVAFGLLTGEDPSSLQLAGAATAIIGVVLVSHESSSRSPADRRALILAGGAALGFGCFFVGLDAASGANAFAVLLIVRLTTVVLLVMAMVVNGSGVRVSRRQFLTLGAIGMLDLAANGAYLAATSEGLIVVASVLTSLYAGVTVLLARAFLSERMSRSQYAGVAAALGGIGLMAAGA